MAVYSDGCVTGITVGVCFQGPPAAAHHPAGDHETSVDLRGGAAGEPGCPSDTPPVTELGEHSLLLQSLSHWDVEPGSFSRGVFFIVRLISIYIGVTRNKIKNGTGFVGLLLFLNVLV